MVKLEIKDEIMMGKMDSREKINKHKNYSTTTEYKQMLTQNDTFRCINVKIQLKFIKGKTKVR